MTVTRRLLTDDEAQLKRFLEAHLDTSMILRSNLERVGVEGQGQYSGDYFGSFTGHTLTAVVAHYWNDNLLVQGLHGLEAAVRLAVEATARPVKGVLGPAESLKRTLQALDLTQRPTAVNSLELLFTLDLKMLQVPQPLADGRCQCHRATRLDRASFLADWRGDYNVEALHAEDTDAMRRETRDQVTRSDAADLWVLEAEGQPVSMSGFNAEALGVVQVGGVWTPMPFRGRGYGRAVVAGSLLDRRAAGATRSVLFTEYDNFAAQRAYLSLGYRRTGEYGMWLSA